MVQPSPGDHVVTRVWWKALGVNLPGCYTHHGIYIGQRNCNGKTVSPAVRHWSSGNSTNPNVRDAAQRKRGSRIRMDSLDSFHAGQSFWIRPYAPAERDPIEVILARVNEQWRWYLDEYGPYHFTDNNCEHFATWCVTGSRHCSQTAAAKRNLASAGGKLGAKAGLKLAARATSSVTAKAIAKTASPWTLVADAGQLATEQLASYCGMSSTGARRVGRGVGFLGSLGISTLCGGPIGAVVGLGVWLLGEVATEAVAGTQSE